MDWAAHLPEEYLHRVKIPVLFETHSDSETGARKTLGFDRKSERCFYFHEYILTEERFDEEEAIFEIPAYHEIVFAWKLKEDGWLRLKACTSHPGDCGRRPVIHPLEIVKDSEIER